MKPCQLWAMKIRNTSTKSSQPSNPESVEIDLMGLRGHSRNFSFNFHLRNEYFIQFLAVSQASLTLQSRKSYGKIFPFSFTHPCIYKKKFHRTLSLLTSSLHYPHINSRRQVPLLLHDHQNQAGCLQAQPPSQRLAADLQSFNHSFLLLLGPPI